MKYIAVLITLVTVLAIAGTTYYSNPSVFESLVTIQSALQLDGATASRALTTDGSKQLNSSVTTVTELSYVSGVTSAIQTQIDGISDPITTEGDLIVGDGSGDSVRIAIGTNAQVLTSNGTTASWQTSSAGFSDPMTTRGDIIYRDATNTTERLAVGTSGYVLSSDGTDTAWADASISSPATAKEHVTRGYIIDSAGTPTISSQNGWIDSLTDNGIGHVTINITAGTFSVAPTCTVGTRSGTTDRNAQLVAATTTSTVEVKTYYGSTSIQADIPFYILCMEKK